MRITRIPFLVGLLVVLGLSSCGGPPAATTDWYPPSSCELLEVPDDGADTVTIAIFDTAVPEFAPWGHNPGEQQLFFLLYETLIGIDCDGRVRPGLAVSWKREDRGRRWIFTLRKGATWSDGTRVGAHAIINGWEDALRLHTIVDSAAALDEHTIAVYLDKPTKDVPRAMSAPAFAVSKRLPDSRWHIGTGRYKFDDSVHNTSSISPPIIPLVPIDGAVGPVIRFVRSSPDDARNLLEREIDLMITSDPAVIEYAAGKPVFAAIELSWDKIYVLISTTRAREITNGRSFDSYDDDLSNALARDAVRGVARGYNPPAWWDDLRECTELPGLISEVSAGLPSTDDGEDVRRILYESDDPVARGLAERIVALAAAGPESSSEAHAIDKALPGLELDGNTTVSEGVTKGQFGMSLRAGSDFAYILALPRRTPIPCFEAKEFIDRVPWLAVLGTGFLDALVPLVETRSHAIARKDKFGLYVDWYNNLVIVNDTPEE